MGFFFGFDMVGQRWLMLVNIEIDWWVPIWMVVDCNGGLVWCGDGGGGVSGL